jgi:PleD family two-component response regulator
MKEFKPDVVLQDLVMPGVDGLNLVQLYKGDPETSKIPVIVLSSEEDAEIKIKAFTVGASDYMVKIPNRVELVCRIREHAKGRIREMRLEAVEAELQRQAPSARHPPGLTPWPWSPPT